MRCEAEPMVQNKTDATVDISTKLIFSNSLSHGFTLILLLQSVHGTTQENFRGSQRSSSVSLIVSNILSLGFTLILLLGLVQCPVELHETQHYCYCTFAINIEACIHLHILSRFTSKSLWNKITQHR